MGKRNLILAVVGAHVCVLTGAVLFGGCAGEKREVKLSTAAPAGGISAPEAEPETILQPKGLVEESDMLVARAPETIPPQPTATSEAAGTAVMERVATEFPEESMTATPSPAVEQAAAPGPTKKTESLAAIRETKEPVSIRETEASAVIREKEKTPASAAVKPERHRAAASPEVRESTGGAAIEPSPAAGGKHRIMPGDSLWKLSQKYGVSVSEIARANGMKPDSVLRVGQVLVIPGVAAAPEEKTPAVGPTVQERKMHVVRKGETLSYIARRYGVSLKSIVEANGIVDPGKIRSGRKLIIP